MSDIQENDSSRLLTKKEIDSFCYRTSTSPEPYAFTEKDGTLDNILRIRVEPLLQAQDDKNRDKDFQTGLVEGEKKGRQSVIKELKAHSRGVTAKFHHDVMPGMVFDGTLSFNELPNEFWQQLLKEVKGEVSE